MSESNQVANVIFEIGDWSSDGHSHSAQAFVKVNKSLEVLRKIHLKENDFFGSFVAKATETHASIFGIIACMGRHVHLDKAYEAAIQAISDANIACEMKEANDWVDVPIESLRAMSINELEKKGVCVNLNYDPDGVLAIWLAILRCIDPSLTTEIVLPPVSRYYLKYNGYPVPPDGAIHFYGVNSENQHLKVPGYGVMNDMEEFFHGC